MRVCFNQTSIRREVIAKVAPKDAAPVHTKGARHRARLRVLGWPSQLTMISARLSQVRLSLIQASRANATYAAASLLSRER
jgi:hypothetical protein